MSDLDPHPYFSMDGDSEGGRWESWDEAGARYAKDALWKVL